MPRVSICLPNLNSRPWLPERLETITRQSFTDWELIVVDGHSDDGAWEFLRSSTGSNPRIQLHQAPRRGPYGAWNDCLDLASGELVYFATSDDTMAVDCLGEMVSALDAHPECDMAQCCLHAIDEHSAVIPGWWQLTGAARFLGDDYLRPHLRRAPYDGVLHCAMHTIYHSITQVLIRRRAFEKTGRFLTEFGPGGDFCWGMKAGLHCDVVHVPKFLATWRIHGAQASATYCETAAERALMVRMADAALVARQPGSAAALLPVAPLRFPYLYDHHRLAYAEAGTAARRLGALARFAAHEPRAAWHAASLGFTGQRRSFDKRRYARALLQRFGLEENFVPLPGPVTAPPLP